MTRYKAIRNSYGTQGAYWVKGDVLIIQDGEDKPNLHFVELDDLGQEIPPGETRPPDETQENTEEVRR